MSDFLSKIVTATREDLEARMARRPLDEVKKAVQPRPAGTFSRAIAAPGVSIIAEVKRASPSKGMIRPDLDVGLVAASYEKAGARAVSVLTEGRYFRGSLADLKAARQSCRLPLLRKDFIVDAYQVWEAADAGADAILLIVAALSETQLSGLYAEAGDAGVECLVEAHNRAELEAALAMGAAIVGINNRDLKTFEVNLDTSLELVKLIPGDVLAVAESGIRNRDDVSRLSEAGFHAVLIGEALMRSPDPGAKIRGLATP